jgi:hypothetical protein
MSLNKQVVKFYIINWGSKDYNDYKDTIMTRIMVRYIVRYIYQLK